MKKPSHTPNYCIRKTGRDIARIAFEIENPFRDESMRSGILLKSGSKNDPTYRPEGLLLNCGSQKPIIAIIHARPGDKVILLIQTHAGRLIQESHFRILETFRPAPIHRSNRCQVIPQLESIQVREKDKFLMDESSLQRLFKDRHPAWLQSAIDTTLEMWRKDDPALFLRVAPTATIARKPELLVRFNPERALENFSDELDEVLFNFCIE